MAQTVTNRGILTLITSAWPVDVRQAVFVGSAPSAATIRDYNFLSDLTGAMTEAAATNYARQDLANVAVTESDASDNVTITADAATITAVGTGETWTTVAYYVYNASDGAAVLLSVDTPASTIVTNGGNITLPTFSLPVAQA